MVQVSIGSYAEESAAEGVAMALIPGQFLQDPEDGTSKRTMSGNDVAAVSESLPDELMIKLSSSRFERQSNVLPTGGFKYLD